MCVSIRIGTNHCEEKKKHIIDSSIHFIQMILSLSLIHSRIFSNADCDKYNDPNSGYLYIWLNLVFINVIRNSWTHTAIKIHTTCRWVGFFFLYSCQWQFIWCVSKLDVFIIITTHNAYLSLNIYIYISFEKLCVVWCWFFFF